MDLELERLRVFLCTPETFTKDRIFFSKIRFLNFVAKAKVSKSLLYRSAQWQHTFLPFGL